MFQGSVSSEVFNGMTGHCTNTTVVRLQQAAGFQSIVPPQAAVVHPMSSIKSAYGMVFCVAARQAGVTMAGPVRVTLPAAARMTCLDYVECDRVPHCASLTYLSVVWVMNRWPVAVSQA